MIMKTLLGRFLKVRTNRVMDEGAPSQSDVPPPNRSSRYQVHHQAYMSETYVSQYVSAPSLGAVHPPINSTGNSNSTGPGSSSERASKLTKEHTVKHLRPMKALTMSESTPILEACRRMAVERVDVLVLRDSNALLCGILTARDITTRVVARELDIDNTPVSAVMTRNPVFVTWDTPAVEALQKMVLEKFRHYPVVKNGKVFGILDVAECLYRAIMGKERASHHTGSNTSIETLGEPSLSTIISENSKLVTVSPLDTILMAAKTMLECRVNSVIVTLDNKQHGILTSKHLLLPIIVLGLSPYSTLVARAMNPYPISVTADVQIVNALHDGNVVAVTDLHEITRAVIAAVETAAETDKDAATSVMQKFWNSAMYPY